MREKKKIFLTKAEAAQAICIDFRQYAPQPLLFASIIGLITDNAIRIKRMPGRNGAWISQAGKPNMQWLEGQALIEFMCASISEARWTLEMAVKVCSRVFQTRVTPCTPTDSQEVGVMIETGMEDFTCRQCGHCCTTLDYRNELTQADVARWEAEKRQDILKWVEVISHHGSSTTYRIWVSPKTGRPTEKCPFLKKDPASTTWHCRIQEIKPAICRQYPTSRKHALMTGCRGFSLDYP